MTEAVMKKIEDTGDLAGWQAMMQTMMDFRRADQGPLPAPPSSDNLLLEDSFAALTKTGMKEDEARARLDHVFRNGRSFASVQEVIEEVYKRPRPPLPAPSGAR